MKQTMIIIAVFIIAIATIVFIWWKREGPFLSVPEQQNQAEVVGRRIIEKSHDAGGDPGGPILYFISFKFSDGSVKELEVGVDKSGRQVYESFHEGDTGMLTYKERKNIEEKFKNEDLRHEGRQFLSFEKDPEYGGIKIEKRGLSHTVWMIIIGGSFIILLAFLVVLDIWDYKGKLGKKRSL